MSLREGCFSDEAISTDEEIASGGHSTPERPRNDIKLFHINIRKQIFQCRFGRSLGKLYSFIHFLLHLCLDLIESLGADGFLLQELLAEYPNGIVLLPLLHFFLFAITLRVAHGMSAVTIGNHLK